MIIITVSFFRKKNIRCRCSVNLFFYYFPSNPFSLLDMCVNQSIDIQCNIRSRRHSVCDIYQQKEPINEWMNATARPYRRLMYVHCLAFCTYIKQKAKTFHRCDIEIFFHSIQFSYSRKKNFFFLSMVMLNGICPNQTSTRTRNPLYRYRLHVSNNKYDSVNIFSFFLIQFNLFF